MLQYVSLELGNILIVSVSLGYVLIMICRCFVFSPIQKKCATFAPVFAETSSAKSIILYRVRWEKKL